MADTRSSAASRRLNARGRVLVGTSGWQYRSWRGDFYPPRLAHAHELEYLAMRVRHPSWLGDEALALMRAFDVALVTADTVGRHPLSVERTATFAYVRLHGSTELYASRYSSAELAQWAKRIADWARHGSDVFIYFDNDAHGHAPHDALRLRGLLEPRREAAGELAKNG